MISTRSIRRLLVAVLFGLASTTANAAPILYATSTDSSQGFFAYDPNTDTWSQKANINTRAQLAADQNGDVYALDSGANEIKRYDAGADTWSTVISGPGFSGNANLEVFNDGRFLLSRYNSSTYDLYDGVGWTSGTFGFTASQLGDYDPFTNTLVIGQYANETAHLIDVSDFSETAYTSGAAGTSERRRAGAILDGTFYQKWHTNNVMGFELTLPPGALLDFGEGQDIWYPSAAADRENGLLYIVGIGGGSFRCGHCLDVYDPVTGTYTALANSPTGGAGLGYHSTAIMGGVVANSVSEPPVALLFAPLLLLAAASRARRRPA